MLARPNRIDRSSMGWDAILVQDQVTVELQFYISIPLLDNLGVSLVVSGGVLG
jgi:hypothetical protein